MMSAAILMLAATLASGQTDKGDWTRKLSFDVPKTWPCQELSQDDLKALWLEGEAYGGKPTRVFAYLALPVDAQKGKKVPGVVLAHGGGGTAYPQWARTWAKKGYASIVVDTCGHLPLLVPSATGHRLVSSGAGGPAGWGRFEQGLRPATEQWPFHAVGALVRAHSYLRSLPEVDAEKTGITGISWGGFLTVLTTSADHRFKFAMPVYACGFYSEIDEICDFFRNGRAAAGQANVQAWDALWDPKNHAPRMDVPTFWFASSNDAAFPFEPLQKTIRLLPTMPSLAIRVRMAHGHGPCGENMPELFRFADSIVRGAPPLPSVGMPIVRDGRVTVAFEPKGNRLARMELNWCEDEKPTKKSMWQIESRPISTESSFCAPVPKGAKWLYVNLVLDGATGERVYPEAVVSSPAVRAFDIIPTP